MIPEDRADPAHGAETGDRAFRATVATAAYLSPLIAPIPGVSKDDGAETWSGLRADPGAVPGASTLAA
jgi:hypothetical protein